MLARIFYTIAGCWRERRELAQFLSDPSLQVRKVIDLAPHDLFGHDVQALVLDFDGVLASHAESEPREEVRLWLKDFARQFAPYKIYILSNKPTAERQAYFQKHFPEIRFIVAKRKKPYPDGMQQIMAESGMAAHRLLLVDDRLAMGVLEAISVGVQGCWVTQPYIDLHARPFKESIFICLRWLERQLVKIFT